MSLPISPEEKRMVDYLLGRLPESERERLAEKMLADDETCQAMLATEELLIDGYAGGELDSEDALLVERMLLATEAGRAKLRLARALMERRRAAESRRRRLRWVAAAVILLACGALSMALIERSARRAGPALVAQAQRDPLGTYELTLNVY